MAITRMNTYLDHASVFDLSVPGTLLPALNTNASFTSSTVNNTLNNLSLAPNARWSAIGSTNPAMCFQPVTACRTINNTTMGLIFGSTTEGWYHNYQGTYFPGSHVPSVFKELGQTLTCSLYIRTGPVVSTTATDAPLIYYGLINAANSGGGTYARQVAYRSIANSGTAHSASTGLVMVDTAAGSLVTDNTTPTAVNWAPDSETLVSIVIGGTGACTSTMGGYTQQSTFSTSSGYFSLFMGLGGSVANTTNTVGIRSMRITVT